MNSGRWKHNENNSKPNLCRTERNILRNIDEKGYWRRFEEQYFSESDQNIGEDQKYKNKYETLIMLQSLLNPEWIIYYNNNIDQFHTPINNKNDVLKTIDEDSTIVRKLRTLQMLNRVAHQYLYYLQKFTFGIIERKDLSLFTCLFDDDVKSQRKAEKKFCFTCDLWLFTTDKEIKTVCEKYKFLMKEKADLINEILQNLREDNTENINYGQREDEYGKKTIMFDVPQYGQISFHFDIRKVDLNDVPTYIGRYLGKSLMLTKVDPQLMFCVDTLKLSEKEKYLYKILNQGRRELATPSEQEQTKVDTTIMEMKNDQITVKEVMNMYGITPNDSNLEIAKKMGLDRYRELLDLSIENGFYEYMQEGNGLGKISEYSTQSLIFRINLLKSRKLPLIKDGKGRASGNKILSRDFKESSIKTLLKEHNCSEEEKERLSNFQGQQFIENNPFFSAIQGKDMTIVDISISSRVESYYKNYAKFLRAKEIVPGVIMQIGEYTYSVPKIKNQLAEIFGSGRADKDNAPNMNEILIAALLKNKNVSQEEYANICKGLGIQVRTEIQEGGSKQPQETEVEDMPVQNEQEEVKDKETQALQMNKKLKRKILLKMKSKVEEQHTEATTKLEEAENKINEINRRQQEIDTQTESNERIDEIGDSLLEELETLEGKIKEAMQNKAYWKEQVGKYEQQLQAIQAKLEELDR